MILQYFIFFYYDKVFVSILGPLDTIATNKIVDVKGLFYEKFAQYLFALIILIDIIIFIIDAIVLGRFFHAPLFCF